MLVEFQQTYTDFIKLRNKARVSFVFVAEYPPRWRNIVEKRGGGEAFRHRGGYSAKTTRTSTLLLFYHGNK